MTLLVGAIIAAAGASRRLGSPKALLAGADGRPFVRHLVDVFTGAGCAPVVVVLGPGGERVLEATGGNLDPALVAFNRDTHTEMIDSLRLGERYLPATVALCAVTPVDAPFATPALVRALVAAACAAATGAAAVPVTPTGTRAHPVVLPRTALWRPEAAGGVRALLESGAIPVTSVAWDDERIAADVNTPADHASLFPEAKT
ncbi:MAG TPA: NTP transferase domain-containing protein [Myxococcota bacterium]|nr:NTP transferase domain-containing protein [Myxococcota bacterium]